MKLNYVKQGERVRVTGTYFLMKYDFWVKLKIFEKAPVVDDPSAIWLLKEPKIN